MASPLADILMRAAPEDERSALPEWLLGAAMKGPPKQSPLLDPFNLPQVRGPLESIKDAFSLRRDEQGVPKAAGAGDMLHAILMGMGRMPGGARVSNPVVPMRPYRPNTSTTIDQMSAANMNPPKNLRWNITDDGIGPPGNGFAFATDAQGKNMAGVTSAWNGERFAYTPRIEAPARGSTTNAHTGPEFQSRDVAQLYADALVRGGKFGPKPDPTFAAPFLEQDAAALRQLLAQRARGGFSVVPGQ